MSKTEKIHLNGINGLRAIAALSVVIFHMNMSFEKYNLKNLRTIDLAGFGVTIFFAISGFLITYLLLKEKEMQSISIKKFYIRRILRIWPLYFLVLIISVFTAYYYNIGNLPGSLLYYIFLAANIPFILNITLPFLGHYWSLGVEEQFYLFWPWLIKKSKYVLNTVIVFTCVYFAIHIIFRFIEYKWSYELPYLFIFVTRFDCMSIGAIGAILIHQKQDYFYKIVTHKITQLVSWLVILLLAMNMFHIASIVDQEIVSIVSVVLIVNCGFNPEALIRLNHPIFDAFGKISYGIYIIHQLIIFYFAQFINNFNIASTIKYPLIYFSVMSFTIITAWISYEFFEKRFLTLKERFSVVKSASNK